MASASRECRITVRLRPRGGRDEIVGVVEGVIQARVAAPPVEGKANESLRRLLADRLGIAFSRVRIRAGEKGKRKVVGIEGMDVAAVLAAMYRQENE